MSLIAMGISHRTAPVTMLERLVIDRAGIGKLLHDLVTSSAIDEALVLTTCNRMEVYVDAEKFHPAVDAATEAMVRHTGVPHDELVPHLYVHYEDRAVQHMFAVASGLDSMVVGEGQILGQVRNALRTAQDEDSAGRVLNDLTQNALRIGKRAHTETGIDKAGASLVSVGLEIAERVLSGLDNRNALVVGAGSMASLAANTMQRRGMHVTVVNRTHDNAVRLAASVKGTARPISEVAHALTEADVVISCTGALGYVVAADAVSTAQQARGSRPIVLLDLALPRDIDPAALRADGVTLVDLEDMGAMLQNGEYEQDVEGVRRIVADEVEAYLDSRHSARVAPTVVALRALAAEIVARELDWFAARRPDVNGADRADIEQLLTRVVEKLLHAPTVRVKELALEPDGDTYAEALHRLFDLDLRTVEAIATPDLEDGVR